LNRRVLASNASVNVFHRGFMACNAYANGDEAIGRITCPVLFLLGSQDQMTQAAAAQGLINRATVAGKAVGEASSKRVDTVMLPVGHHQMTEAPEATLAALKSFLNRGE
jgi:pimeloyl-ACP methyl ester carboxylesterase